MRIGTAGWSVPRDAAPDFPGEGQHLDRYARVMNAVEVNSSFYRSHRLATWARWATQTPADFRFAVKVPRAWTHERRLDVDRAAIRPFLEEIAGLEDKLRLLLVQLPPSLAFDERLAHAFFAELRAAQPAAAVVCEPRHASWFAAQADRALATWQVARAAADPARWPAAARPGGWLGPYGDGRGALLYYRWHGTPRVYWSRYETSWIEARLAELSAWPPQAERWCIFDNTAAGAALVNALELQRMACQAPART